ncbi:MAG: phosphonate C-P lyase system protein PhnH [Negativicutes bacterium]|nr:phosphonate C-P lyase system protein PhnH [Negativicutes bacterium]
MTVALEPGFDKVFDTQKFYRIMLDVMARPGKIGLLPAVDLCPPSGLDVYAAGIAFTLLDGETGFAVLPEENDWQDYLRLNTGSGSKPVAGAEFIFANGKFNLPEINAVSRGSLLSPEQGGTLIVQVDRVTESGQGVKLTLTGPGIKDSSRMVIAGFDPANLERVLSLNQEFPLGVDVFFVDTAGNLAAMPRSSSVEWEVTA